MLGYLQGCEKGGRKGGGEGRWTVKEKEGKGKSKDAKRYKHTHTYTNTNTQNTHTGAHAGTPNYISLSICLIKRKL